MDVETFDQIMMSKEKVGDDATYLKENTVADVMLYE